MTIKLFTETDNNTKIAAFDTGSDVDIWTVDEDGDEMDIILNISDAGITIYQIDEPKIIKCDKNGYPIIIKD